MNAANFLVYKNHTPQQTQSKSTKKHVNFPAFDFNPYNGSSSPGHVTTTRIVVAQPKYEGKLIQVVKAAFLVMAAGAAVVAAGGNERLALSLVGAGCTGLIFAVFSK